jgi:hypothetical protein
MSEKKLPVHRMEAGHQVSGHLILTCPACGRVVQIEEKTLKRKTIVEGDALGAKHVWIRAGLSLGASGSKEPPSKPDTPLGGGSCALPA